MGRGLGTPSFCIESFKKAGSYWESTSLGVGEAKDLIVVVLKRCSQGGETLTSNPSPPSFLARFPPSPLCLKKKNKTPFLKALFNWFGQTAGLKPEHWAFSTYTVWRPPGTCSIHLSLILWWWVDGRESWGESSQRLSPWAQRSPKLPLNCVPFFGSWDGICWPCPSPQSFLFSTGEPKAVMLGGDDE